MSRLAVAVVVIILALATAGCFPVTHESEVVMEAPVEATLEPLPAEPPGGAPPARDDVEDELVTPTPGMADIRPVPWDAATVAGTTVTVSWWSGVAPCNVLDRVEVDEGDEVVTVTLFEGSDPGQPDTPCNDIAQRKRTEVELTEPVGQRRLVDGADPAS